MKKLIAAIVTVIALIGCKHRAQDANLFADATGICAEKGRLDGEFASGDGSQQNPYLICSAEQFDNIRKHLHSSFRLAQNIDLKSEKFVSFPEIKSESFFLDGNGFAIKNIRVTADSLNEEIYSKTIEVVKDFVWKKAFGFGLFTKLMNKAAGARVFVRNLTIENADVVSPETDFVGALAGVAIDALVENISIKATVEGRDWVGGIFGIYFGSRNLTLPHSNINIKGSVKGQKYVGGFGGSLDGEIARATSTVSVKGQQYVGGLIGKGDARIKESLIDADVNGDTGVGGVIGIAEGSIAGTIVKGKVSGSKVIGGFIGYSSARIDDSYSVAEVSGDDIVGGIVGSFLEFKNLSNVFTNVFVTVNVKAPKRSGRLVGKAYFFDSGYYGQIDNYVDAKVFYSALERQTSEIGLSLTPKEWKEKLGNVAACPNKDGLLPSLGEVGSRTWDRDRQAILAEVDTFILPSCDNLSSSGVIEFPRKAWQPLRKGAIPRLYWEDLIDEKNEVNRKILFGYWVVTAGTIKTWRFDPAKANNVFVFGEREFDIILIKPNPNTLVKFTQAPFDIAENSLLLSSRVSQAYDSLTIKKLGEDRLRLAVPGSNSEFVEIQKMNRESFGKYFPASISRSTQISNIKVSDEVPFKHDLYFNNPDKFMSDW